MPRLWLRRVLALVFVVGVGVAGAKAQVPEPPSPAPLPGGPPNLFFGAVPPGPVYVRHPEVIVFLHGLNGVAMNWWVDNDMYAHAYRAGYRTAFVSMDSGNLPDARTFIENGDTFASLLPTILAHYGVDRVVVVGHSKGGLDAQAAIVKFPAVAAAVKTLFTISTPNTGSELADWLFDTPNGQFVGSIFGLLTPGVASLRPANVAAFRAEADPVLRRLGIPIYTINGDVYVRNLVTLITGGILKRQVPSEFNDGFVTGSRSRMPHDLGSDLGRVRTHHFDTDSGSVSFAKINAQLQALEQTLEEFKRIEAGGFGDPSNTWIWSMQWFQGKLYLGTGREIQCVSVLTADVQTGSNLYPLSALGGTCPAADGLFQSLRAEIWQFTPETGAWRRVYQSPVIEAGTDPQGNPAYTARDIGYRGMTSFVEPSGQEVLYVGGVTSGSIYDNLPPHAGGPYPPPRLLRSVDGEVWEAVPQDPGTFLGDVASPPPGSTRKARSFRALKAFNGKLFATVGDFRGVGYVVVSERPWEGNNAWAQASPNPEDMPVWNLEVFADHLYMTTGDRDHADVGFGLYKTDAAGSPPYAWQPVLTEGAFQADPALRAPNGLSFAVFQGHLYLGTNRPTELYRIRPDDTWDLVVGEPRMTPSGFKTPVSGLGIGFGSWFNGHFWRMAVHGGRLYLTTWDSSSGLRLLPDIDQAFAFQYGFDFYRTEDGVRWTAITRGGMGEGNNSGGRSLVSTPAGLFLGSARASGGGQVFQCVTPDCSTGAESVAVPRGMSSASEERVGRRVVLRWDPTLDAVLYRVYRATVNPLVVLPGTPFGLPSPFVQVGIVFEPRFEEDAPTALQSLYFVRAEDVNGNLSAPSNFVGAPSKADQVPPTIVAPRDVTVNVEAGTDAVQVDLGTPVAFDDKGGPVTVRNDAPPGNLFLVGRTTVRWTAVDSHGNLATATQRVTVQPLVRGFGAIPIPQGPGPRRDSFGSP